MTQLSMELSNARRPTRHETLMGVAELFAARSTCSRAHVGAVVARDGRILVTGYNGAPRGMPHCNHTHDLPDSGGCKTAVHAEANAISFAARHGINLDGSQLYSTFTPCLACSQLIVNSGINRVYIKNEYRLADGKKLLSAAKIDIICL